MIVNRTRCMRDLNSCELLTCFALKQQKKELPPFSAYRLFAATNIFRHLVRFVIKTSYGIALCTQSLPVIFFSTVLISILNDAKLRLI